VHLDENQAEVYGRYFSVVLADTPDLLEQVYRLRYQVYCVERAFENPHNHFAKQEMDEYDRQSVHAALVHRPSGTVCGCVRLILPREGRPLPITKFVPGHAAAALETRRTAEVSRYAVSKAFRRRTGESDYPDVRFGDLGPSELRRLVPHITLGLMLAVATLSEHCGISHLAAVLAPALLRLLRTCGMNFVTLGPLVEHHGTRQPCFAAIDDLLKGVKATHPAYFKIICQSLGARGIRKTDVAFSPTL
jgi:N-acyl amino acid synthase of PEP-CTERM/exosortase system